MGANTKIVAYYLPQFHPIAENDEWWGKGFTEWTNVAKAQPLYKGHYQPRYPADLGYYDLRLPEVRKQQADMAREAGVHGFCYWHYWFGNGKKLIERPFQEVLKTGEPDFPFCLAWANESWEAKIWNAKDTTRKNKLLIEQVYPGAEDDKNHFYYLLDAFKDKRYIRFQNRPIFTIYRPQKVADLEGFIKQWNALIKENGVADSFYFIANVNAESEFEALKKKGIDAITASPTARMGKAYQTLGKANAVYQKLKNITAGVPKIIPYEKAIPFLVDKDIDTQPDVIPSIVPNWDHSPRSGRFATVLHNSTPAGFKKYLTYLKTEVLDKKHGQEQLVLLKSWNEWGEGNYIEPDSKYGTMYLEALKEFTKLK